MNIFNISYLIQSFQKYWICILLIFAYRGVVAQCGFQATCPNTNYLNFGMGSNGDAATIEYDNFVSMFHSTVVRTAYGSYETWGQKLANDGVNNLLSPTEINNTNFPNLTGTILKAHLGSDYVNIGQGIVLTTTGLFAWSDEGAILHPDITTGSVFQKLTINGETDGLPPGINPLDVKMIFTTHGTVALVTCAGDVYVITQFFNNTGAGHTTTLTIAEQTQWYRVRQATSGNPFLTNIVAVRGNRNTLFALKSDGSLWTWGSETYLGNNTAHAARNYATSMTIPTPDPIKMIGVTRDNSNSRPSYYVLNANGNLYSMGHNARKQLGDWTVTERLQWVQPKYTSSSGPVMNNIHWISTNEHDSRYAAINVLNIDSTNYNWGDANGQMLGRGGTGTFDPGIPNGISISDKVLAVETGGHTSMLIKKCEDFFGYVGHRISGSMGDGTNASTNESTYTFNTAVVYICGATTAEISLSGTPEFGTNGRYCNESTAELTVYPPGGTLSVISGSGSLSGNFLTFSGMGNDTVTIRYVVSVPGCPIPDTAYLDLLTEDCYFPSWKLTKTAQTTTYSTVGEVINYSIELENTGNVSIGSVVVTDILATTGPTYDNGDNNHNDSLDINEIWIYSATRNITQNDLDFGSFTNTANVTGIPYRGNLTDTFDIEIITANQNPSIEIIKTAVPTAYSTLGEEVEYSFVVNNTGNVTLTNVEVTDPLFGLTFGPVTLAPGTSQTYNHTYTVTQMALDTGSVYNVASVTSEDTNGNPIEDSDDETISANQNPSIDLIKSALPELYSQEGDEIEYTFTVNNTGNVTLTNVIVSDPLFNITFGPVTLSPNESESYTFTYEITQIDLDLGSVFNEASVSGFFNGTEYPATDDATITAIQNPGLNLVKTALPQIYSQVGEEIEYSFQITNTGNVTLENIDVFDPLFSLHFTCLTLAPGQVETYTYTYNVTQEAIDTGYINNIASSHFVFDSKDYYDSDDETITAHQNPSIEIIKTAVPATYSTLGEEVEYSFVVNNTGNVTLTNAEVTDPLFGLTFGPVTLAPGTSQTYTHTYTVTQMALDTGSVYNVASVTSEDTNGNQISDYDDEVIVAIQSPNLELLKSALPTSYSTLGEEVEYSFVVNNTGNVTLTNAEVTDPLFGLNFGPVTLAPGTSQTYTHTYTVTQMALDTGSVYNVASVTSEDTNGNPITDSDDETITANQNPSIEIIKTAVPTSYSTLGEEVEYSFVVNNTGNVTLTNAEVTDPLFGLTFGPVTLAPGTSQTYTHTYTVTQMALDTGSVYNVASVTSEDTNGNPITDTDDETITANQNPSIEIIKTAVPVTYSTLGEEVEYSFVVNNTGNVTLTNVEVTDPLFGLTFGPVTLAPGTSQTYTHTYTVTQMALDTGSVYNVASVTSEDTNGNPVEDSDDETITANQNPSIEIIKTAVPATYSTLGEEVEYSFVVNNTGNVTLTNVEVTDPLFGLTFGPVTLAPGTSQTYTHTYTVTQMALDTGSVYNVASVTSEDTNGNPVEDSDDETITANQNPSIEIIKTAVPASYSTLGEEVEYSFVVNNTGNVTLTNVEINDPLFGLNFGPVTLAPGTSQTYTHTYTVTQMALDTGSVYNVASVTSEDTNGNPITDTDDETITANQNPSIEIIKTAVPATYSTLGEEVEYSFVVNNTGNVTLTNAEVTDPLFGLNFGPVTLAPGTSQTYTHTYTVTQMALDTGSVYNVASVTSEDTNGNPITDSDDETITANQNPSIEIIKTAVSTSYSTLGEEVEYSFVVNNTGNVTLTNAEVTDPLFGLTFGPVTLAPGTSQTYTHTYTVTQMALDTGSVYNVASVTSEDTNGNPVEDSDDETITAHQNPSIEIIKTAVPATYSTLGEEVEYSFVVNNTGNVTLTNVEVTDPLFGLTFGPVTLAPGTSQTYTHTYTVTQMALDTGSVYNVASVTSEDTNGNPITDTDDETITANQNPSVEIIKTAVPATYSTLGEEVEYSFVVNNTGNVTLTNAEVTDPLFGLTFGPVTLAPGTSQTYNHTYTVTQMALDTGSVYNVASVTSEDTNSNPITDSDDETITADQNPSIEIIKTAVPTIYSTVGEEVEYSFVVNNTGNVTLTNVEVTDPLFGLTFGPITLAPGTSQTYTHTYTVTQMALDTGSVYNVASVTSEDTNGNPVEDSDDETITANQNPSIEIIKTAVPATYSTLGEEVEYSFVVNNTGNVTLTNVEINDPLFGLNFGPVTLAPGTSQTYTHTYTVTQMALDTGSVYNVASVTSEDTNGNPITESDDETITANQNPSIEIIKTAVPATYSTFGEEVEYSFVVNNTGNVTLTNVEVTDPLFGLSFGPVTLAPGTSQTYTHTYTVTQMALDTGSVYNVASVTSEDTNGNPVEDSDDETITANQNPSIEIIKTAVPATYSTLGEEVEYSFVVNNTGNVTLTNVEINDPLFGLNFGPVTLAPGTSQTYTHTYTVTQMALDTGSVYNVASVTSEDTNGNPITDTDDETITANQNPSIEIIKTAVPATYSTLGEEVEYSFVVNNTGNVTLTNAEVTDPLFGLNFGPVTLAPGTSQTYTHTYTVTQMALDTGSVYNVASVTSEDTNGNPITDSDDETITANQNPSIEIIKTAVPTSYSTLGEEVEYSFVVNNTGNVTLTNAEVTDPLFGLTFGPVTLAPGTSQTYTHTYTVTQMALDTGSVYNVASVTSEDTNGNPVEDSDDETITAHQNPSIEIIKTAVPATYSTLGEEVEYSFVVNNTGNVTLTNAEVTDPLFGLTFGPVTLAPGTSQTYTHTYTVTQMALDTGSVYNVASVTSEDTNGNPITDTDDETITANQNPSVEIIKTAVPATYSTLGEEVEYSFVVNNTGNVTLTNAEVTDPLFGLTFGPVTLAPGTSQTYNHTYTVTQMALDTGSVYNVASVTSEDTNSNPITDSDDETITADQNPSIEIIKTAVPTIYSTVGEEVEYSFVVNNTGNVTLTNVEVTDPLFGLTFGPITLAPGTSQTYTHTYTVTQMALDTGSVYNVASVTSEDTNGNPVEDSDDETITANQNPSIEIIKTAVPATYSTLGEEVEYSFVVNNTGNVTLTNVEINDPLFGLNFGPVTLAPGTSQTYTHTYTVTQMALDTGSVYNVASVTSEDTNGNPITESDDETITANQNPSIEIIKTAVPATYSTFGEEVEYSFVVNNTGNVTLTNAEVTDPLFGLSFGPVTLAPGTSQTYTHTYTVTQMALDTGSVYNVASVTSEDTNGNPVEDSDDETITANQNPSIEIIKTAVPATYSTLGEEVEYSFVVNNTGNVTLTNAEVTDPLFGLNFGPVTLAPGTSQTYTHTYTVTQMALDTGSVYNVASVTSEDTNSNPITDSDDETITAHQNPSIEIIKTAVPATYSTLGEEVEYSFVVNNTGNVTLTNVEINDPLFGLNFGPVTLAPGTSQTYTHTYTVTQMALDTGSVYNVASVTSEDTNGNPITDTDDETITANQNPSIEIIKTAVPATYSTLGEEVEYSFVVNNTGNVTLTNVEVTDPLFGLNFGPVTLAPGTSQTYTHTYTVTQMALDTGSVYNVASVTSEDTNGNPVEDSDDETITANQNPSIEIIKTAVPATYSTLGEEVEYSFVVNNTGNVTLTNAEVTDPLFGLNFGPVTLAPGTSQTYTHTYTVTQMALDTGSVYNVASVTSEDTNGNPVEDSDDETITAIQNPLIRILKEGVFNDENFDGFAEPGETTTFSFLVTNQGNVTLSGLFITDPVIGISLLPVHPSILLPGQTGTAMAVYNLTQEIIDAGGIYNVAEVSGTTRNSQIVRSASSDPTPLDPMDPDYDENCPSCTFINLKKPSSISDFVWEDKNGDGIQNLGEPGIPHVYVHLYKADGTYLKSVLTNSSGKYIFNLVLSGSYQIRFDIPSGFTPTFPNIGNDDFDSDINQQGLTGIFYLDSETYLNNLDAGFYQCSSIGELIWYDSNKNDIADDIENGINGLKVLLFRHHNGNWIKWDEVTSGHKPGTPSDDGYWEFCAPPGQYYVQVVMPPLGLVRARYNVGNNPYKDSDLNDANGILSTSSFFVTSGQDKLDIAAGFYPMAVAGNLVWFDENENGIQDVNESVAEGVQVSAIEVQTGLTLRTSTTDQNGLYELDYLEKRDVFIKFDLPDDLGQYNPTTPGMGSDDFDSDVDGTFGLMTTRAFKMESGMIKENIDMGLVLGPLPVEWGDVFVVKVEQGHKVQWSTLQEVNSSYFVVERKLEGQEKFKTLSPKIPAAGQSKIKNWYEYIDNDITEKGFYHYRISQFDLDGKEIVSEIVSIKVKDEFDIEIYPNPSIQDVNISMILEEDVMITLALYDNEGKFIRNVFENELIEKGNFNYQFSFKNEPAGLYNLIFQTESIRVEKRLIKIDK